MIHKADFLHRDIAPDNIIIRKDGSPVLIDFGSARGEIASHSKTVSALVKPGYSPYEQYATTSRQQGPWTDIYALGATLYHAITGKRPPDAPSRMVNDEYRAGGRSGAELLPRAASSRRSTRRCGSRSTSGRNRSPNGAASCSHPIPNVRRAVSACACRSRARSAAWAARSRPRLPRAPHPHRPRPPSR